MFMFISAKGGSGCTVTAAACALALADMHGRALLVDLLGDAPAALGLAEPTEPGAADWLSGVGGGHELLLAATSVNEHLTLIPRGASSFGEEPRWELFAETLCDVRSPVVVDAGGLEVPAVAEAADEVFLVIRPCYLALRRALSVRKPTGVIVLRETGRALSARDIESVLSVPVVAEIGVDATVARAVDAGLLASRATGLLGSQLPLLTYGDNVATGRE